MKANASVARAPTEPGFYWAQISTGEWELVQCTPQPDPDPRDLGHKSNLGRGYYEEHPCVSIAHVGWDIDTTLHSYVKFVLLRVLTPPATGLSLEHNWRNTSVVSRRSPVLRDGFGGVVRVPLL